MEEPSIAEMLRGLRGDVQRMIDREALYVTQEQRASDAKVFGLQLEAVAKDQAEDRARLDNLGRMVWSAVIGPVIVGVILYFLLGGKP